MKSTGECSAKDGKDDTERGLFARLFEDVVIFVIAAYLIRLGVYYILEVKIPLTIITVIVGIVIIGYRSARWRKHHDDY